MTRHTGGLAAGACSAEGRSTLTTWHHSLPTSSPRCRHTANAQHHARSASVELSESDRVPALQRRPRSAVPHRTVAGPSGKARPRTRSGTAAAGPIGAGRCAPPVGLSVLAPVATGRNRFPPDRSEDQRVVTAASSDARRGVEVVATSGLDPTDVRDQVDHVVDRDELGAADADRNGDVRLGELEHARDPVVDVREAARWSPSHTSISVSPVIAAMATLPQIACGRLLALTVPCSVKAIDVVAMGDSSPETVVLNVFTHP
jgi:hypothetical protein